MQHIARCAWLPLVFMQRNVFLKNKQDQMDENENDDDDEDIADPVETPRACVCGCACVTDWCIFSQAFVSYHIFSFIEYSN